MYTQIFTPPLYRGKGGGDRPPQSFWYVVVFQNNFAFSEKPLIFSTRWGINYFMGGGAAGGLWHHQRWSPFWLPSWILPRIRNQVKTAINGNFLCWTCKITHKNKHFASFYPQALLLLLKGVENTCIFTQKKLDQLLLMISYLITIETDNKVHVENKNGATHWW